MFIDQENVKYITFFNQCSFYCSKNFTLNYAQMFITLKHHSRHYPIHHSQTSQKQSSWWWLMTASQPSLQIASKKHTSYTHKNPKRLLQNLILSYSLEKNRHYLYLKTRQRSQTSRKLQTYSPFLVSIQNLRAPHPTRTSLSKTPQRQNQTRTTCFQNRTPNYPTTNQTVPPIHAQP